MPVPGNKFFETPYKVALALILPGLLVYLKSLGYGFTTMDEQWMIVKNAGFLDSEEAFKQAFTTPLAGLYYRPVLLMSIILDYKLGGLSPFIYHLTNLFWHLLSVLLLYRFLGLFNADKRMPFFLSIIFSIHPLALHAVAWVPGRNDTMLFAFAMASFIFLKKYHNVRKIKFLLAHLLFFLLAMGVKETAIVLPVLYLAAWWIYSGKAFKGSVPVFVAWILLAAGWFLLRKSVAEYVPPISLNFLASVKHTCMAMIMFTGKIIFPFQLSVFPTLKNASMVPGILALLLLIILYFKPGIKNKKVACFGLVMFFILLVIPVWYTSINTSREHYEHRAYLPLAGMLLFLSQIKFKTGKNVFYYTTGAIAILLSIKTFTRMEAYKDKPTFLSYAVKEAPDYYLFQMQMGEMYYAEKNLPEAIRYYTKALEIRPNKYELYNNRGGAYFALGRYAEAINDFTKAIQGGKFDPSYYLNRCAAYHASGQYGAAMKDMLVLLDCCKNMIPPGMEEDIRQKWMATEGKKLQHQIEIEPNNAGLYFERAKVYLGMGQTAQGMADLKKACELAPDNQVYLQLYLKKSGELR